MTRKAATPCNHICMDAIQDRQHSIGDEWMVLGYGSGDRALGGCGWWLVLLHEIGPIGALPRGNGELLLFLVDMNHVSFSDNLLSLIGRDRCPNNY